MLQSSDPKESAMPPPQKKRFVLQTPTARKPVKVPRARDITTQSVALVKPSEEIIKSIGCRELVVGVDIETHDWKTNHGSKGGLGQYGHYARCNSNDHAARIVQIGWAVWKHDEPMVVKERLVKPQGYTISAKATRYHGISQAFADSQGMRLRDVLNEFMQEMSELHRAGARIVVHHLEFDCGIISKELGRACLDDFQEEWAIIARNGLCTMDPSIGKWVRTCKGLELAPCHSGNTMKLDDMLRCLVPDACCRGARHSAGCDARLHVLLYNALYDMVREAAELAGRTEKGS
jgi:hypothetical protein